MRDGGPTQGFGPARSLPGGAPALPSSIRDGSFSGYDPLKVSPPSSL